MFVSRAIAATLLALIGVVACDSANKGGGPGATDPAALKIVAGDNQTGFMGTSLPTPLEVQVSTAGKNPVPGTTVSFKVSSGSATITPAQTQTGDDGHAKAQLTLGSTPGEIQVVASVDGTTLADTLFAVSGSSTVPLACQTGSPTLPAVSSVNTAVTGNGICLSGGATGADYTLIAFDRSTVPSALVSVNVTGHGINLQTAPSIVPATGGFAPATFARAVPSLRAPSLRASFDARLRSSARRFLTPMMPAARLRARTGASFDAIPSSVTVGQILRLNTNSGVPCDEAVYHGGRVVAITAKAIIVADTLNPPNGFSDAQYQSIGVTFDNLVDPLDRGAFGEPSDVDKNGKVVIFYTRAVNELTPSKSTEFVGGFFYERDLFPTTATQELQACAGSNVGEMFYMLAPDPTGIVNGNRRDTAQVRQITIGTVAHEYQHLINAAHRLFITNADFEEVWLNEGLSHIAEELLFYRVSGLAPRQNLNSTSVRSTPAIINAFNEYVKADFDRFEEFLQRAPRASPYADDDSLQTRGGTWAMLRYLADHRGSADADTWTRLINAPSTGVTSLRSVFGNDFSDRLRDWGASLYTDDFVAGNDARYLQPSWDFRSLYTNFLAMPFPLKFTPLADGVTSTQLLESGGSAYLRFSVSPGAQGSINWNSTGGTPASPLMKWTLVRTK